VQLCLWSSSLSQRSRYLSNPIEKTATNNTGDPFHNRRYYVYTKPFHRARRGCRIDRVDHCIFYDVIENCYATLARGTSCLPWNIPLVLSWYTQVIRAIFPGYSTVYQLAGVAEVVLTLPITRLIQGEVGEA